MINAQDNGVQIADLNSQYWQEHFVRFGRVPGVDAQPQPGESTAPVSASPVGQPDTIATTAYGLPNPLQGASDALQTIVGKLTARDTYVRVALVVIGGALLLGGVVFAVSQTETGAAVIQAGGRAAGTAAKTAVLA